MKISTMILAFAACAVIAIYAVLVKHEQIAPPKNAVTIITYSNGEPRASLVLTNGAAIEALVKWIEKNQSGWLVSFDTWAPQIIVDWEDCSINFTDDLAVLSMPSRSLGRAQYLKQVDRTELYALHHAMTNSFRIKQYP